MQHDLQYNGHVEANVHKCFWSALKVISLPAALVTFFFPIVPNVRTFCFFKVSENLKALLFNNFVANSWKISSHSSYAFVSFWETAGLATTPDESCNSVDSSSPDWFDMQLMVDRILWISSSSRVILDLSNYCLMQGSWFWPAISLHFFVMTALAGWEITHLCSAALCCVNPVIPPIVLESRLQVFSIVISHSTWGKPWVSCLWTQNYPVINFSWTSGWVLGHSHVSR